MGQILTKENELSIDYNLNDIQKKIATVLDFTLIHEKGLKSTNLNQEIIKTDNDILIFNLLKKNENEISKELNKLRNKLINTRKNYILKCYDIYEEMLQIFDKIIQLRNNCARNNCEEEYKKYNDNLIRIQYSYLNPKIQEFNKYLKDYYTIKYNLVTSNEI